MKKSRKSKNLRNLTMEGIALPDKKKIKKLSDPQFRGTEANKTAEEIFEGNKIRKSGSFDTAIKNYSDNKLSEKVREEEERLEEEKANFQDFEDSFIKKQKEELSHRKGRLSRMRKNAIITSCILFACLLLFMFFFPPVMVSSAEDTTVLYYKNIFEKMGLEEYKAYAQANYSVYSEEAFSSEKKESYRTVILGINVHNLSPFELEIPHYKIISCDPLYKDKVCYVGHKDDKNEKDSIAPFGINTVYVKVLINVTDMDDEKFTDCIDSLIISTSGMRKLWGKIRIPSVPSAVFISDKIEKPVKILNPYTAN